MNKEPRYKDVVVDFVDRVHGTGFPEIRPWKPLIAIPVEFVDVVTGTDGSGSFPSMFPHPVSSRQRMLHGRYPLIHRVAGCLGP